MWHGGRFTYRRMSLTPPPLKFDGPLRKATRWWGVGVAGRFSGVALLCLGVVIFLAGSVSPSSSDLGVWAAVAAFGIIAGLSARGIGNNYPHPRLGMCNVVTLLRAAMVAGLCAVVVTPGSLAQDAETAWTVLGISVVALTLDGLDGWLARRAGLTSAFGARLDMEVDAVFALILAVVAFQTGKAGLWILLLGTMRYAFVLAGLVWPRLRAPLFHSQRRRIVCVIQIAALIVLLAPIVTPPLSGVIAGAATGLLIWSFWVDSAWLLRRTAK